MGVSQPKMIVVNYDKGFAEMSQHPAFRNRRTRKGTPWMSTLAYGYHEDRTPTHGYEPTREAAMAAFAKSWQRSSAVEACLLRGCTSAFGGRAVIQRTSPQ